MQQVPGLVSGIKENGMPPVAETAAAQAQMDKAKGHQFQQFQQQMQVQYPTGTAPFMFQPAFFPGMPPQQMSYPMMAPPPPRATPRATPQTRVSVDSRPLASLDHDDDDEDDLFDEDESDSQDDSPAGKRSKSYKANMSLKDPNFDLNHLTAEELREELKLRRMQSIGSKSALIERLKSALQQPSAAALTQSLSNVRQCSIRSSYLPDLSK